MTKLIDLQLLLFENESSTSASCLFYIMNNEKINQNERIEYVDLLKHRDIRFCCMSVIINYFV